MSKGNNQDSLSSKSLWQKWKQLPKNIWGLGLLSCFMQIGATMVYTTDYVFVLGSLFSNDANFVFMRNLTESVSKLLTIPAGYLSDRYRNRKAILWIGYGSMFLIKIGFLIFALCMKSKSLSMIVLMSFYVILKFTDRVLDACRDASRDALISESMDHLPDRSAGFSMRKAIASIGSVIGGLLTWGLLRYFNLEQWKVYALSLIPIGLSNYFLYAMVDNVYVTKFAHASSTTWNISIKKIFKYTIRVIFLCSLSRTRGIHDNWIIDIARVIAAITSFYYDYNLLSTCRAIWVALSISSLPAYCSIYKSIHITYPKIFAFINYNMPFWTKKISIIYWLIVYSLSLYGSILALHTSNNQLGWFRSIGQLIIDVLMIFLPFLVIFLTCVMLRISPIKFMPIFVLILVMIRLAYFYWKNNYTLSCKIDKNTMFKICLLSLAGAALYAIFYILFSSRRLACLGAIIVGSFIKNIIESKTVKTLKKHDLTDYYLTMFLIVITLLGTITKTVFFTYGRSILGFEKITTILMFVVVYIFMCGYSFVVHALNQWKLIRVLIAFGSHMMSYTLMILWPNKTNLFVSLALEGIALGGFDTIFKTWIADSVKDHNLYGLIFGIYSFTASIVQIIVALLVNKWMNQYNINGQSSIMSYKNVFTNTMYFQITAFIIFIMLYSYKQYKKHHNNTLNHT